MPTIFRFGKVKFKVHANDHGIPHVHVEHADCYLNVDLTTMVVMELEGFKGKRLRRLMRLIKARRSDLLEAWSEYHD